MKKYLLLGHGKINNLEKQKVRIICVVYFTQSVLRQSTCLSTFQRELEQLWPISEEFVHLHAHR